MNNKALRKAAESGLTIECTTGRHEGWPVYYMPRVAHDPKPWVLATDGNMEDCRYDSTRCRVAPTEN